MSRPLAEWEQRAVRYGVGYPILASYYYDKHFAASPLLDEHIRARRRASSQRPAPLTMGQKVFREGAYLVAGGVLLKGAQMVNWGIRGARPVQLRRSGLRYRDIPSGRLISRSAYRSRPGLYEKLRTPDRMARITAKRVESRIARSRTYRGYAKIRSIQEISEGPAAYLIHRYTPRSVKVGFGVYSAYRWASAFWPSGETGTETVTSGSRADPNFILNQRLPPHLGSILQKKSGSRAPIPESKSTKGCPPGHRWSSRLRKCVRVGRR